MTFHRLTVPSYSGGLRAGDDYINNAVSGTPAPADTVLAAGLYSGSYFFAPSTPVTGANINRGFLALANNCDLLDNRVTANEASIAGFTSSADAYADAGDATTLAAAKAYADSMDASRDAATLASAHTYADTGDALRIPLTQRGAANGVATLDAGSKVPKAQLALTMISLQSVKNPGSFSTASFSYVDVTGFTLSIASCQVGDVLDIRAIVEASSSSATNPGNVRVVVVDPGATQVGPEGVAHLSTTGTVVQSLGGLWTVVTAGTIVVKVQAEGNGTGSPTTTVNPASTLQVLQYRP